jgi:hypothetical protein
LAIIFISIALSALVHGCARSSSAPMPFESPEQRAARVFALAQELEADGQTRKAYAAYHQIIKHFPTSPSAIRANARLTTTQATALRRSRNSKKKA